MGGPGLRLWCCSGTDGIAWEADTETTDQAAVRVMTLGDWTYVGGPWSWADTHTCTQSAPGSMSKTQSCARF